MKINNNIYLLNIIIKNKINNNIYLYNNKKLKLIIIFTYIIIKNKN